ncbi:MAG: substrate-binding domain-containing protein [Pseudomonadales bacterium]|nr:substrate-binding domain-containing protein [Pseudomonadales bacterium]
MKNLRFNPALILFSCLLLSISCGVKAASSTLFTLQGSNTVGAKLAPQCARAYLSSTGVKNVSIYDGDVENEYWVSGIAGTGLDLHTVSIKIAAHGSSTGFKGLNSMQTDIAMSSRPIKKAEVQALSRFGPMKTREAEHTIAIDGLAVLVNKRNPVSELSITQIAQLFSGEISNWKQLGGIDAPVVIYARDDKSGTWDTFKKLVLAEDFILSDKAVRFESNDELSDSVANQTNAIGFSGLSSVRRSKLLAVSDDNTQAMKPSAYTVATEDYPLARRLYFYMPPKSASPWVRDFIAFCQSDVGQRIVESVGFVSQNIRSFKSPVGRSAAVPQAYQTLAQQGRRLSVNFRFSQGSPRLDNKAHEDIRRLLGFLRRSENQHKHVYLIGFSDAGERLSQDLVLSRFRALAVRSALLREGVPVAESIGLGSFMPVASNDNEGLKLKNGRVEVWLTDAPLVGLVQPESIYPQKRHTQAVATFDL